MRKFNELNVKCHILDNVPDKKELAGLTDMFLKLSYCWFKDKNGNDIFEYDGVPLAECCANEFIDKQFAYFFRTFFCLEKIVRLYSPEKIYYDSPISDIIFNCLEILKTTGIFIDKKELLPGKYISPLSVPAEFSRCVLEYIKPAKYYYFFSIFNFWKKALSFFSSKKSIMLSLYNNTDSFIDHNDEFKMFLLNLRNKFKNLSGDKTYFKCKVSGAEMNDAEEFEALKKIANISENFKINGFDFWSYFEIHVKKFLKKSIPEFKNLISELKTQITSNKPLIYIEPFDVSVVERIAAYICRASGIKTVKIQHGYYFTNYITDTCHNISDFVFTVSPQNNKFDFSGSCAQVMMSSPLYDSYSVVGHVHKKGKSKYTVIINPYYAGAYILHGSLSEEEIFITEVLNALSNFKERFNIIIRQHPGIVIDHLKYIIENDFRALNITYSSHSSFLEAISETDLFISMPSTAIFESSAAGVPSIFYNQCSREWLSPFDPDNKDLPQAKTDEELTSLLEKFLNDFNENDWFVKKEIIQKYSVINDGKNSARIWKKIKEII